jgi:hypothetical protein
MSTRIEASGVSTPTNVSVNGTPVGQVPANFPVNVVLEDEQGNVLQGTSNLVGSTLTTVIDEWQRNPLWLALPTVTSADNKLVGLFAVFENDFNTLRVRVQGTGLNTIDFGDGTTDSNTGDSFFSHTYNYTTVISPIITHPNGRNYKMVVVEISYDDSVTILNVSQLTSPATGTATRTQPWLDVICSSTRLGGTQLRISEPGVTYNASLMERLILLNQIFISTFRISSSLKVLDVARDWTSTGNAVLEGFGDVRDSNGQPVNLTITGNIDNTFARSNFSKMGNFTALNATSSLSCFNTFSSLEEIGDVHIPLSTSFQNLFNGQSSLRKVGKITISSLATTIAASFNNNSLLEEIEWDGNMSGVSNTSNAYNNCFSLRKLLMPNLTIGFNIRDTLITGTPLQDLFTSLGTAAGSQTITLPAFTVGEPTTIATTKGYTIAYA